MTTTQAEQKFEQMHALAKPSLNDELNIRCEHVAAALKKLMFANKVFGEPISVNRGQLKSLLNVSYLRFNHTDLLDEVCLESEIVMTDVDGYYVFTPAKKLKDIPSLTKLVCSGIKAEIDTIMNVQPKPKRGA